MTPEGLKFSPGDFAVSQPQSKPVPEKAPVPQPDAALSPEKEEVKTQKRMDPDIIEKITSELNNEFRIFNASVSFSVDDNTGTTVIKIMDRDTEKVIREIPPNELLEIAAKLTEVIGRLVDETA